MGVIGTVLGGLATAMAGGTGIGLLGGNNRSMNGCPNANDSNTYVTKAELNMTQELARKDSEIALLKSEQNTEIKIADVFERVMTRVNQNQRDQDAWNASQSVVNAQMSSAISTNASSIASLQNTCAQITKTIVPITSVCPEPMKAYNSWTAPTN